jgi:hypothetical protein
VRELASSIKLIVVHSIRWGSSQVEPIGDFYELRVNLDAGNSDRSRNWVAQPWTDAFNDETTRRYKAARGQRWGTIALTSDTVIVQELEAGAEAELMQYLNAIVAALDDAEGSRPASAGSTDAEADGTRERLATAEGMATRFRAGTKT